MLGVSEVDFSVLKKSVDMFSSPPWSNTNDKETGMAAISTDNISVSFMWRRFFLVIALLFWFVVQICLKRDRYKAFAKVLNEGFAVG